MGSNADLSSISKLEHLVRAMFCAPGRNRTYDQQIRRLLLYPLSYGGRAFYAGSTPSAGSTVGLAHHCSAGSVVCGCSRTAGTSADSPNSLQSSPRSAFMPRLLASRPTYKWCVM
jgi:hypothetical protein